MSLYADRPVSERSITIQIARLKVAFPKMNAQFFNILSERIEENSFTEQRLEDAVNSVIDSFRYRELNVADVIGFDRRAKLYTGSEYMTAQMNGAKPSDFERRRIGGTLYWVKKTDLLNS